MLTSLYNKTLNCNNSLCCLNVWYKKTSRLRHVILLQILVSPSYWSFLFVCLFTQRIRALYILSSNNYPENQCVVSFLLIQTFISKFNYMLMILNYFLCWSFLLKGILIEAHFSSCFLVQTLSSTLFSKCSSGVSVKHKN